MSLTTQSIGFGDSDSRSYYCLDCDTRHDLRSDVVPYVCDANRNFENLYTNVNFDNADVHRDYPITRVSPADLARYQIYAIDPVTGNEIPNIDGGDASARNQITVSQGEWDTARQAISHNTRLPLGVSTCMLNSYHSILEKNRARLAEEYRELIWRKEAADALSQRQAELSTLKGSGSRSHNSKYKARTPRLSE